MQFRTYKYIYKSFKKGYILVNMIILKGGWNKINGWAM
jgi:hypothetical protein